MKVLLILSIIFLSMKIIETKSVDIQNKLNHSRVMQWSNERRGSISTTIENDQLEDAPSPSFFPEIYHVIAVILMAILILYCCCKPMCEEDSAAKRELDAFESRE